VPDRVWFVAGQPRYEVAHRWFLEVCGCVQPGRGVCAVGGPVGGGGTSLGAGALLCPAAHGLMVAVAVLALASQERVQLAAGLEWWGEDPVGA